MSGVVIVLITPEHVEGPGGIMVVRGMCGMLVRLGLMFNNKVEFPMVELVVDGMVVVDQRIRGHPNRSCKPSNEEGQQQEPYKGFAIIRVVEHVY